MIPIRVLVVDDQTIICDGLRALLDIYPDISIIGCAYNGDDAYEKTCDLKPDLVLMDISMPGMNGVEATHMIKKSFPDTVVILLTTFDDDEYIIKAMTYGASGYLLKDISSEQLVDAIRNAVKGNVILPGRIAAKLVARIDNSKAANINLEDFTQREMDIIQLLLKGKNNREIASELFLSVGTVKNYVTQIFSKLNVRDRTSAVIELKNMGL